MSPCVINRPTELVDHFSYLLLYAGEIPDEDQLTDAEAFAKGFDALEKAPDQS